MDYKSDLQQNVLSHRITQLCTQDPAVWTILQHMLRMKIHASLMLMCITESMLSINITYITTPAAPQTVLI